MNVLLVSSWNVPCGIAEHSAMLVEAVRAADPSIRGTICEHLDPAELIGKPFWEPAHAHRPDLLWLNYQAGLLSQWTPEWVQRFREFGIPIGITYHDTGVPNSDQCKAMHAVADAFVIHEPCDDLPGAIYWRQGVPAAQVSSYAAYQTCILGLLHPPVLGSVGFPFPWKNYGLMADAAREAGWSFLCLAAGASDEFTRDILWRNPRSHVVSTFTPRREVVSLLAGCDATMFLYMTAGTGTSAAIRQGIAARKPVLATLVAGCRMFRDLEGEPAIRWLADLTVPGLAKALSRVNGMGFDGGIVELAERDSWAKLGVKYARLFHQLVEKK